jgi:spore maturation protein CgeB
LWAAHPGWKRHGNGHPLVGRNFSRAMNSCRIFVTTGGIHRNPQPKIFEALASRTLLMSDEPVGAAALGLVDGETYVRITPGDVLDRIDHYLARPELCERIAEAGYRLAMARHSCYARALDLRRLVRRDPADPPIGVFSP